MSDLDKRRGVETMSDLDKLVSDYRAIKASHYLATRVEAHVNDSPGTTGWRRIGWPWTALGAGAFAAGSFALVIGLILTTRVVESPPVTTPEMVVAHSVPGFSQLAGSPVTTASISPPSFANLRSVNSPALPPKPENPAKPVL